MTPEPLYFGLSGPALFISSIVGLLAFVFWIWMIVDCVTNSRLDSTKKVVWLLVIFFLHALGALIYFAVERSKSTAPRAA